MPDTFNVISLGTLSDIDSVEGNMIAEDAQMLVGLTFGGPGDALVDHVQTLSVGTDAYHDDGNSYYDMNGSSTNAFNIDGGGDQVFDGTSVFNATLTYVDGTTADISAVIFQDVDGNTYLSPEFSANADQDALEAKPIQSMTLNSLVGNRYSGMTGNRQNFDYVACFVAGTLIETNRGPRPVEHLTVGDLLVTRDNGMQPLRWISRDTVVACGNRAPVRINAGALGAGLPKRMLRVSQQHRVLIKSRIAQRMMGADEVLVPAKKLLGCAGVTLSETPAAIVYHHLLLDRHEVIFAEGTPVESLLPGPMARAVLGDADFAQVEKLFPDILKSAQGPARKIPKGHQIQSLVMRHAKNAKPFFVV